MNGQAVSVTSQQQLFGWGELNSENSISSYFILISSTESVNST